MIFLTLFYLVAASPVPIVLSQENKKIVHDLRKEEKLLVRELCEVRKKLVKYGQVPKGAVNAMVPVVPFFYMPMDMIKKYATYSSTSPKPVSTGILSHLSPTTGTPATPPVSSPNNSMNTNDSTSAPNSTEVASQPNATFVN